MECRGAYEYADQADDLAAFVDRIRLPRFALIGTSRGEHCYALRSTDQADRLTALVINDIGPDVGAGSNRVTGMIGPRPDAFVTFEAAVAYRREISPITAARPVEDQFWV